MNTIRRGTLMQASDAAVPSTPADPVRPEETGRPLAGAERLLAFYQQTLGHDLANKLVAIQGLARLLGEDPGPGIDAESRAGLERLADLAREIHARVSALAEVGRAYRAGGPRVPIPLAELWDETAAEVCCRMPGCAIRFERPAGLPTLVLPARGARRFLLELLRYCARRSPSRVSLLRHAIEAEAVRLTLRDDGRVLDPVEAAFEPVMDGPGGPDLRLFLARLLAESWGGTLRLEAPPDGGCLISVTLPAALVDSAT